MTTTNVPRGPGGTRRFGPKQAMLAAVAIAALAALGLFLRFASEVHALRERRASRPGWSFPSRIYSDGVAFVLGRTLPLGYLENHLHVRGYRGARSPLRAPGTYAVVPGGLEIYLRGFWGRGDPAGSSGPERVRLRVAGGRLERVDRLGGPEHALPPDLAHPPRLEPVLVGLLMDEARIRREWVPLARIPRVMQEAVVAAEDRRFYGHIGFDLRSTVRALVRDVRSGGIREGASTITQQLAREIFLDRKRTIGRKGKELLIAAGLEILLSKQQILEMYLNSVYWGQGEGDAIGGVAEAARWYFDTPVESLTVAQAALLTGLIPAPNASNPFRNPGVARARRDGVVRDLVATRKLRASEAVRITRAPIRVRRGPARVDRHPSFTGYVLDRLEKQLPDPRALRRGLSVFTTLDLVWQAEAERALADGVADLERWRGREDEPLEGAFVAMESATGVVRAMVGGRNPLAGDFNRAFQARRQPGSAIKPVVYAAALDARGQGTRWTPASVVPDQRRDFVTPQGVWSPRNDEGDYHAQVTLAKALAKSLNVATANLVEAIGPMEVTRHAERFGLGALKPVASVGLGTTEVTLVALTNAYQTFPNGGLRGEPTPLRAVVDAGGHPMFPSAGDVRVLPEQTAALMTGLLEDVVIFGVSYPLRKQYGFTRPTGGKTGTTNDYRDAWFIGFTPEVTAGVWVGYDSPRSLRRPAAESALPVWAGILKRLLEGFPPTPFAARTDIVTAWIDPWTGGLSSGSCPSTMRVPFAAGTEPRTACRRDHSADWARIAQSRDSLGSADSLPPARPDTSSASLGPGSWRVERGPPRASLGSSDPVGPRAGRALLQNTASKYLVIPRNPDVRSASAERLPLGRRAAPRPRCRASRVRAVPRMRLIRRTTGFTGPLLR